MGVNTTFRIRHEIKRESAANAITVLHYRLEDGVRLENGSLLVSFHAERGTLDTDTAKVVLSPSDFLLFLRMRKDGRFELVSGQLDPPLSVRSDERPKFERDVSRDMPRSQVRDDTCRSKSLPELAIELEKADASGRRPFV